WPRSSTAAGIRRPPPPSPTSTTCSTPSSVTPSGPVPAPCSPTASSPTTPPAAAGPGPSSDPAGGLSPDPRRGVERVGDRAPAVAQPPAGRPADLAGHERLGRPHGVERVVAASPAGRRRRPEDATPGG